MKIDLINGTFECLSALFMLFGIFKLYKDKELRGYSAIPVLFFTLWGLWNLYFYSNLGLDLSFIGSCCIFMTNSIWLGQVIYYNKFYKA